MEHSVLKSFVKFVGLNTIGTVMTAVCILIDYWFIATAMGTDGLTAFSFAVPTFGIVYGIGVMLGVGGGAKYAELRAGGENDLASKFFTLTVKVCCVSVIPFILVGIFFSTQLGALLGAEGHILPMSVDYLRMILILSPCLIFYAAFESLVRNDNAPKVAMIASVTFSVMNIVLDYFFIMVFKWEMLGAGLATTVAAACGVVILLAYWGSKKSNFKFVKTRFMLGHTAEICQIGGPSFITEFLSGFILITYNLTFARLAGNVGVAAFGIVSSISYVVQYLFIGLGQGIQPMGSYYYGTKNNKNLIKTLKYAFFTSTGIAAISIAILFLFTDAITMAFNSEQDMKLAELSNFGIRIFFLAFGFYGVTVIITAFLSVTSAPKIALVISILQNGALLIPTVLILSQYFGITGAWLSFPLAELALSIASIIILVCVTKRHKKKLEEV